MNSGKDLVGKMIWNILYNKKGEIWEIKKFAKPLKEIISIITGIPVNKLENKNTKQSRVPFYLFENKNITVRETMQFLGTDIFRKNFSEDIWVNILFRDYYSKDKWIITDVRFENEIKKIKEKKGILIKVQREYENKNEYDHISEKEMDRLDPSLFDYILINDSNKKNLKDSIIEILIKEKLI